MKVDICLKGKGFFWRYSSIKFEIGVYLGVTSP